MKFNETTIRILVRKNYGECFDFYTEKIGLIAVWGDRNDRTPLLPQVTIHHLALLFLQEKLCQCFKGMNNQMSAHSQILLWQSSQHLT